ncbi:hypothetical protein HW555_002444 [Spodoptera exigua]|uniref:Uncharacterized protein n=1 Tax=Spodoptera exigua TaxID=7107 RepID=A0A835L9I0_SPOEX|nr:hypothetical protein HW555_002444 [Spodoptera exigua]
MITRILSYSYYEVTVNYKLVIANCNSKTIPVNSGVGKSVEQKYYLESLDLKERFEYKTSIPETVYVVQRFPLAENIKVDRQYVRWLTENFVIPIKLLRRNQVLQRPTAVTPIQQQTPHSSPAMFRSHSFVDVPLTACAEPWRADMLRRPDPAAPVQHTHEISHILCLGFKSSGKLFPRNTRSPCYVTLPACGTSL